MSTRYEAYGVAVRSDLALRGLREAPGADADVLVEYAEGEPPDEPDATPATTDRVGFHSTEVCADGGRLFRLASHGGELAWSMRVDGHGRRIEVKRRGPVELADIAALVEVTGLPAALARRGVPLLHGAAFEAGGAALAVLGTSGAGKSTLAAAAVAGGHALLADDVLALDGDGPRARVQAGGALLKMNPDTATAFAWDPDRLERVFVTPGLAPKLAARLRTADGSLCSGARTLAAIFVLAPRGAGPAAIRRLAPAAALPVLLRNTYADYGLDAPLRARLLDFWARLARDVPVHAVTPPDAIGAVPALVEELAAAIIPQPCDRPSSSSGPRAP